MEHELPGVLDGVDEPVTAEELEAVVRRAGQRRRASVVAGAAAVLAVGALGGALARGPVTDSPGGFAASPQDSGKPKPPGPDSVLAKINNDLGHGDTFTPLFRREANGVAIRAYIATWSMKPKNPACGPFDNVHGELSNAAAVTIAMAPHRQGDAFALLGAGMFGRQKGEPATWAVVRGGTGVTEVRFRLGAASDSMAPQSGVALLAVPGDGGDGVVEGIGPDGAVVATQKLSDLAPPPMNPACVPEICSGDGKAETIEVPAVGTAHEPGTPPPANEADKSTFDEAVVIEKKRAEAGQAANAGAGSHTDEGEVRKGSVVCGPGPGVPHGPPLPAGPVPDGAAGHPAPPPTTAQPPTVPPGATVPTTVGSTTTTAAAAP